MGILPKQAFSVAFGKPDQTKNPRNMVIGELLEAHNVRMFKEGFYEKRLGFDRTVYSFETSPGTPTDMDEVGGVALMRDSNGIHHALDVANSTWRTRGTDYRCMPETIQLPQLLEHAKRPYLVCGASNQVWVFWIGRTQADTVDAYYQVTCIDYVTQRIIRPAEKIAVTNIKSVCPVYDATSNAVWLFVTASTVGPALHKFSTTSPTSASTNTTYTTLAGSSAIGLDARIDPQTNEIVVVQTDMTSGFNNFLKRSLLDRSTGQAKTSPVPVTITYGRQATNNRMLSAPHILTHDGANTSSYVAFFEDSTSGNTYDLRLVEFTTSTLAAVADSLVVAESNSLSGVTDQIGLGVAAGYRDANARWIFGSVNPNTNANGGPVKPQEGVINEYRWNGSLISTTFRAGGAWLGSGFIQRGSDYLFVSGFDDGENEKVQRAYFLRDQNGRVYSKALAGKGSAEFHVPLGRSDDGNVLSPVKFDEWSTFVPRMSFLGGDTNKPALAVLVKGTEPKAPAIGILIWDFAANFGPPTEIPGSLLCYPGGIPFVVSQSESLREVMPTVAPIGDVFINSALGSAEANTRLVSLIYRWRGIDGRLYRSAPSVPQSYTFRVNTNAQADVLSYHHYLNAGADAEIEIYLSALGGTGSLHLTYIVKNDPTQLRTRISTVGLATDFSTTNPVLYTEGEVLENEPLPPCRVLKRWRERLHLGGLEMRDDIRSSAEFDDDSGPKFHITRRSFWSDGKGHITGLGVNDWNYLSIFRENAIGTLSGPGPTPDGAGNYIVQTLTTEKGVTQPRSIMTTPYGLRFQNAADGRICSVRGQVVEDVMHGADDYRTGVVGTSLYVEKDRQAWFYFTDGRIIVEDFVFGRWYSWSSAGLLRAYASALVLGVPLHLDSDAATRRQSTSGYQDFSSGGAVSTAMDLLTADICPLGILNPFNLVQIDMLADCRSNGSFIVEVYPDYASSSPESHVQSMAAGEIKPWIMSVANCHDVGAVRLKFRESPNSGAGIIFAGFSITVQNKARSKMAKNGQRA